MVDAHPARVLAVNAAAPLKRDRLLIITVRQPGLSPFKPRSYRSPRPLARVCMHPARKLVGVVMQSQDAVRGKATWQNSRGVLSIQAAASSDLSSIRSRRFFAKQAHGPVLARAAHTDSNIWPEVARRRRPIALDRPPQSKRRSCRPTRFILATNLQPAGDVYAGHPGVHSDG